MTRNHLTDSEVAAYRGRQMPPPELLGASDHLAGCEDCRAKLLQLASSAPAAAVADSRDDVSYEELTGWLDDQLDPLTRREVAATLANSPHARAQLADLTRFRDEMNVVRARDHAAAPQKLAPALPRWVFPLAAAVLLSGAAIWWATNPRSGAADFVKLRDGDRVFGFSEDGRSPGLAALPQGIHDSVAETVRTGRIEVGPEIAALLGQTGTLAGASDEPAPLRVVEPVGTAVRDGRPRFRWTGTAEAAAYQINVMEETSGALLVSKQLPADATEWQPREPLPAGELFQWEVLALRDGSVIAKSPVPPEPEARFQTLSQAKLAEVEEANRASGGSHLVMGVANARAGLLDDAVREFQALAEQNPDAELPRNLVRQLKARAPVPQ